jgi:hypothetical protein
MASANNQDTARMAAAGSQRLQPPDGSTRVAPQAMLVADVVLAARPRSIA